MKQKKYGIFILSLIMLLSAFSFTFADGPAGYDWEWKCDSSGWYLQFSDGSFVRDGTFIVDGCKYSFDENGYLSKKGWYSFDNGSGVNQWYYVLPGGVVACSQWIDGTYYVDEEGWMLTDTVTPDGYYVNVEGKYVTDKWYHDSSGWYYQFADGSYAVNGNYRIGGILYSFDADGYLNSEGWHLWSNDEIGVFYYYYVLPGGITACSQWIDGTYYVDESGCMLTDTVTPDGYPVNGYGEWAVNRWMHNERGWWYHYADGSSPSDAAVLIDDVLYSFDGNGYLNTAGWHRISDTYGNGWIYVFADGTAARNQWIDGTYYMGDDGWMFVNSVTPDGYVVDEDGKWVPGRTPDINMGWYDDPVPMYFLESAEDLIEQIDALWNYLQTGGNIENLSYAVETSRDFYNNNLSLEEQAKITNIGLLKDMEKIISDYRTPPYSLYKPIRATAENGSYSIRFNYAEAVPPCNGYSNVFKINFTYENIDRQERMSVLSSYFDLYDDDNKLIEYVHIIKGHYPQPVWPGESCTAELYFGTNNDSHHAVLYGRPEYGQLKYFASEFDHNQQWYSYKVDLNW